MDTIVFIILLLSLVAAAYLWWQSTVKPAPFDVLFEVRHSDPLRVTRSQGGWLVATSDSLHPVSLRVGTSPSVMDAIYPLVPAGGFFFTGETQFPASRCFFEVTLQDGRIIPLIERHLPLEGAANFRDLGGYETLDGSRVAWGRLFRSDELYRLKEPDQQLLATLGLHTVVDLRNPDEVARRPDRLPVGSAYINLPVYFGNPVSRSAVMFFRHRMDSNFKRFYRDTLVDRGAPALGRLLRLVADPARLPLLFHCTAGKDRTGVAAMLLLSICGVPRQTIIADYTLTNLAVDRSLSLVKQSAGSSWSPPGLKLEQLHPLFSARAELIEGAFGHIESIYGSLEEYLYGPVGLTPADAAAIRDSLVVSA